MPGVTDAGVTGRATGSETQSPTENPGKSLTLIQSLQRGLRLVEVVVARGPRTARELSDAIGIGLPTTYHLLRTLVHEDYLVRTTGGRYALGPQLHSAAAREKDAAALRLLREAMAELRDATAATVVVAELDGSRAVITHLAGSRKGPRPDLWIGRDLPLHATAVGKAVLGVLDPAARARLLSGEPLESFTYRTAADPKRLCRELEVAAVRAAADEYLYGVACLAVPLPAAPRPAALAVSFPSSFGVKRRRELEEALISAAAGHAAEFHDPEAA
jgi:DNA-binding IclR family transcriptional regulator